MKKKIRLPGFGLALGFSLFYLGVLVLIPLAALGYKSASGGWSGFWETVTEPRVMASFRVSFGISALAAVFDALVGGLAAWVLVRYSFPGKRWLDAVVDLPIALPTAVAGIALTALYAPNGLLGQPLAAWGWKVAYTPVGIFIALSFIGLPFVIRTLQPALRDLPREMEEAAATLGAGRLQILLRVLVPTLWPAWFLGALLAFGRAAGEYGSVVFIAGNLPFVSEISPLLIISKLEQYDYAGAAAIGVAMLVFSLVILIAGNWLQARLRRQRGEA